MQLFLNSCKHARRSGFAFTRQRSLVRAQHRPLSKSGVLQDFYVTEARNLRRYSLRAQQRSDAPTSGVRNAYEPRIGPILRVVFIHLCPEGADQGNGNERRQAVRVKEPNPLPLHRRPGLLFTTTTSPTLRSTIGPRPTCVRGWARKALRKRGPMVGR